MIHDTNYPGITVYGTGGQAVNEIVNNWIFRTGDHGIQAAADALITGNVIAEARNSGIYSREHQQALPANLLLSDNWILATGPEPAIRIMQSEKTPAAAGPIRLVSNQLWTRHQRPLRVHDDRLLELSGNRGIGTVEGMQTTARQYRSAKFALPDLPSLPANHPAANTVSAVKFKAYLQTAWSK